MCFSLPWLEQVFIWLIVICGCFAIIRLLFPIVLAEIGALGTLGTFIVGAIRILIWMVIAIFCVMFAFELISCLLGGSIHLPQLPRR